MKKRYINKTRELNNVHIILFYPTYTRHVVNLVLSLYFNLYVHCRTHIKIYMKARQDNKLPNTKIANELTTVESTRRHNNFSYILQTFICTIILTYDIFLPCAFIFIIISVKSCSYSTYLL